MSAALATTERGTGRAMIVADALTQEGEQRKLLGEYVAKHMQEDTDYGIIPGTKNRTLLKPGAEKLTSLFRCVPQFVIEEKIENWDTGLFFYRFSCHVVTLDGGNAVAEGVGSCSSYESRYRWRNANRVCPECGKEAIIKGKAEYGGGWLCFKKKDGCGAKFADGDPAIEGQSTGRVQNPDLADCANTVLKIAKKRAHVDAAIALARCSDIFTQDVEDFQETHRTPDEPARGNYDPRTVPGVKSGADLKPKPFAWEADILAAKTLDDLAATVKRVKFASEDEKNRLIALKDQRKQELAAEGEQSRPPSANGATIPTTVAPNGASAGDAPSPHSGVSALSTKMAHDTLPKAPKKLTANYISDLLLAVAERTQTRDLYLIETVCNMNNAPSLEDMDAAQLAAADKFLREHAEKGVAG